MIRKNSFDGTRPTGLIGTQSKEVSNNYLNNYAPARARAETGKVQPSRIHDGNILVKKIKNEPRPLINHRMNAHEEKDKDARSKTPNEVKSYAHLRKKQDLAIDTNLKRNVSSAKPKIEDLHLRGIPKQNLPLSKASNPIAVNVASKKLSDTPMISISKTNEIVHHSLTQETKEIKNNGVVNLNKPLPIHIKKPLVKTKGSQQVYSDLSPKYSNSEKKNAEATPKETKSVGSLINPHNAMIRDKPFIIKPKPQLVPNRPQASKIGGHTPSALYLASKGELPSSHRPVSSKQPSQSRIKQISKTEEAIKERVVIPQRPVSSKPRLIEAHYKSK